MRIQKYLSEQKICSRREAEAYISQGLVTVNGIVVTNLATQIDPDRDTVVLKALAAESQHGKITIAFHKPRGVISVPAALPAGYRHLNSVGRLDKESEGLLLFSNDGAVTTAVTGSDHRIEKEYIVEVRERVTDSKINKMQEGIRLEDGMTLPARAEITGDHKFRIILKEGRKHQIRRMCEAMHLTVTRLTRVRIGDIHLGTLAPRAFRKLASAEISALKHTR